MNRIVTSFFICAGTYAFAWFLSKLMPDFSHLWYYWGGMFYVGLTTYQKETK